MCSVFSNFLRLPKRGGNIIGHLHLTYSVASMGEGGKILLFCLCHEVVFYWIIYIMVHFATWKTIALSCLFHSYHLDHRFSSETYIRIS